ncbi:DNA ligase I [Cavenderia fasciculata]|uniref:DNA ligase n=1 Tax=Cavenderia fasciculata TaxID=261658 RepID=F4PVW2_CACFS|nr:DNA ligase I [Cavenderia fasciculata]EGG20126.1 DNA ligase I [Cavenderia fasciculata]|eukprot:XP_004367109.1 DNA ligase I [Cavenderia fasciculata]
MQSSMLSFLTKKTDSTSASQTSPKKQQQTSTTSKDDDKKKSSTTNNNNDKSSKLKRKNRDDEQVEEEEEEDNDIFDLSDDDHKVASQVSSSSSSNFEEKSISPPTPTPTKPKKAAPKKPAKSTTKKTKKMEEDPKKNNNNNNSTIPAVGTNNNNTMSDSQESSASSTPIKSTSPIKQTTSPTKKDNLIPTVTVLPTKKNLETTTSTTSTTSTTTTKSNDENEILEEEEELEEEEDEEEVIEEEFEEEEENEKGETVVLKKKIFVKKPVKQKSTAKQLEQELTNLSKYHPITDAQWKKGLPVPYMALAKTFELIEGTSRRLLIIEHLTNLFRSIMALTPGDLINTIYMSINKIGPSYGGKELGIGESILMKAVAESTGRTMEFIKQELKTVGDLGIIAQSSRMTQTMMFAPPPLTIQGVFKIFSQIADMTGNSSQNKKKDLITKLLVSCKESEALYIIRSLQGKLRIGLAERSVLIALTRAMVISPPALIASEPNGKLDTRKGKTTEEFASVIDAAVAKVTRAYSQLPNYDLLVPRLIVADGVDTILETCRLMAGIPVKPMLAQPTTGITQVLDRFQEMEFTCEFKYDGERAQIHLTEDGKISIYTRNLEDYTGKYPDIIANVKRFIGEGVTSFILDCEAVAYDPTNNKILSFQILSSRPRKGVSLDQIKIPVCVFAFDLLYLNGKSLIDEPFYKRREVLYANFKETPGALTYAKHANISDVNDIQLYLQEAIDGNCEGLMVKTLKEQSIYEPSKRSYNWLKIKKDYMAGMTDSVDVVPIGAWYGKGKRTGVYGAYLLACYDDDNEDFQTLCKIGTGFSDEQLKEFTEILAPQVTNSCKNTYIVSDNLKPDVWFNPSQVWEVLAADLSISPIHTAAVGVLDPNKGIALRFPRFIQIRKDKNPEDATTASQIVDMYKNQKINSFKMVDEDY